MAFLHAYLLGGLVLASVPIIIHLLNRRRFVRVDWAPMKYLKLTIKTNRRRLRIEQLILLAVRTLAIAFLIFLIARPVLARTGLGAWLGGHGRTSRVIVIDDSLSMGYRQDQRTAMDRAKDAVAQLIKATGTQDGVTVFVTSAPNAPLVHDAHLDDKSKLLADLSNLKPSDTASDWAATLKAADEDLSTATYPAKEVVIVTDLRKSGWADGVTEIANRWEKQGVGAKIIDVGARQTTNVALLALEQETPIALPGSPVSLKALIRNDTAQPITGGSATLVAGDDTRPILLPDLAPGKVTEIPLTVTFEKPGQYPVKFTLAPDSLDGDNTRYLGIHVRSKLDIALIDGDPSAQPFENATDFLQLAFSIGSEPWHASHSTDAEWHAMRPIGTDVLVLADVQNIPDAHIAALEKLVASGMGLMIFTGDSIDPNAYNGRLFHDGKGLLPAKLDMVVENPVTGLVVEKLDNSPLEAMAKIAPEALARLQFKKYMGVTVPGGKLQDVRVLARWNDSEARPAVIEKRFGRGRVILWTMTANKAWSEWPKDPTFVLAMRTAAINVARPDPQQDNSIAGEPVRYTLDEGEHAVEAKVAAPGKDANDPATLEAGGEAPTLKYAATSKAGVYTFKWNTAAGGEALHMVCVSPDKAESDLEPLTDSQLSDLTGNLKPELIHFNEVSTTGGPRGREIWRTLAMVVLSLFVVETVMAVWVGRER